MIKNCLLRIFSRGYGTIISLEGNIASGKTSVLSELKKRLPQCVTHEEPVEKWRNIAGQNILDLMYQDTKRWGFLFQSYVQLTMFQVHQQVLDSANTSCHILERSIYSARYCFVENFKRANLMSDVEIAVVDGWFRFLTENNRCPMNMIIYLRTSPQCVYKRILDRARPEERVVSPDYVEKLHDRHENWLLPSINNSAVTIPKGQCIFNNGPFLPKCKVLVIDATLPWQQVCEQIRDIVVPTILNNKNLRNLLHN